MDPWWTLAPTANCSVLGLGGQGWVTRARLLAVVIEERSGQRWLQPGDLARAAHAMLVSSGQRVGLAWPSPLSGPRGRLSGPVAQ